MGRTRSSSARGTSLPRPRFAVAAWPSVGSTPGALHQRERALAGVGTPEYDQKLRRSLQEAEAVLVLNPLTAAMLEPYASRVCVVPWGIDPARFPWAAGLSPSRGDLPVHVECGGRETRAHQSRAVRLFMAAVAGETIKGYHVAHEACRLLRQTRSDFELVVTFDPPGPGRSTSSRGRSAGARRPSCRGITGPPISAWCRRSPRTR